MIETMQIVIDQVEILGRLLTRLKWILMQQQTYEDVSVVFGPFYEVNGEERMGHMVNYNNEELKYIGLLY